MFRFVYVFSAFAMLVDIALVATGVMSLEMLVFGGCAFVVCVVSWMIHRGGEPSRLAARRAAELPMLGIERRATVVDCLADSLESGGPIVYGRDVRVILRVEFLPMEPGDIFAEVGGRHGSVRVTEASDDAKARIGSEVVIRVHPEDPSVLALDGFTPNGDRR